MVFPLKPPFSMSNYQRAGHDLQTLGDGLQELLDGLAGLFLAKPRSQTFHSIVGFTIGKWRF